MNRTNNFLPLLVALMLSVALVSCNKDDNTPIDDNKFIPVETAWKSIDNASLFYYNIQDVKVDYRYKEQQVKVKHVLINTYNPYKYNSAEFNIKLFFDNSDLSLTDSIVTINVKSIAISGEPYNVTFEQYFDFASVTFNDSISYINRRGLIKGEMLMNYYNAKEQNYPLQSNSIKINAADTVEAHFESLKLEVALFEIKGDRLYTKIEYNNPSL